MQRIALVCNSKAVDLHGGAQDAQSVYNILVDSELGQCDTNASSCLIDCCDKPAYQTALGSSIESWSASKQLVLYYSGHGVMRNSHFCFVFGENKDQLLPFSNVISELAIAGVTRALIIIDACHSGGARLKNGSKFEVLNEAAIPNGMALLASSNEDQWSAEFDNGSGSVFTSLLCQAVNTGLDSTPTTDGLIAVTDVMNYISKRIRTDDALTRFLQTPNYQAYGVDRHIWLSKNTTERGVSVPLSTYENPSDVIRSVDELRFVYETSHHLQKPCPNSTPEHVDWMLIDKYVESIYFTSDAPAKSIELLDQLGLLVPIGCGGAALLHYAATLCFSQSPERVIPSSYCVFIAGDASDSSFSRRSVSGPLVHQIEELTKLTLSQLDMSSDFSGGINRSDMFEVPREVIREAISNAVVHRDYESSGTVQVCVTSDQITISNPGSFPDEATWSKLLNGPRVSCPKNGAITLYVSRQMGMEGIGRGFEIFRAYIRENGNSALSFTEITGPTIQIEIKRHTSLPPRLDYRKQREKIGAIFVGRYELMEDIKFNLSEGRNSLLLGRRGSGKTTLLAQLAIDAESSRNFRHIVVDASSCTYAEEFLNLLFEKVGRSELTFSSSRKSVDALAEKYLSLLDENKSRLARFRFIRKTAFELLEVLQKGGSKFSILVDNFDVFCRSAKKNKESKNDISLVLNLIKDVKSEFHGIAWLLCVTEIDDIYIRESEQLDTTDLHELHVPEFSIREVEVFIEKACLVWGLSSSEFSEVSEIVSFVHGLSVRRLNLLFSNAGKYAKEISAEETMGSERLMDMLRSRPLKEIIFDDLLSSVKYRLYDEIEDLQAEQLALILYHSEGLIHVQRMQFRNLSILADQVDSQVPPSLWGKSFRILAALEHEGILVKKEKHIVFTSHYDRAVARGFADSMDLGFYETER